MNPPKHPKGYMVSDWPLFHKHKFTFGLCADASVARHSTIVPYFNHDEEVTSVPSALHVNPIHADFAESSDISVHSDAKIKNFNLDFDVALTEFCTETEKIKAMKFWYWPMYMAFLEDYTPIDEISGTAVQAIVGMTTTAANEEGWPLWNAQKCVYGDTMAANVLGLTTNQIREHVGGVTTMEVMYNAMKYYTIGGKVGAVLGKKRTYLITEKNPLHINQHGFVNPKVKSANHYMFCGAWFGVIPDGNVGSLFPTGRLTSTDSHLYVNGIVQYQEWMHDFDQSKEN